jgi:hypothetical protein
MKTKNSKQDSVTAPLLKELVTRDQANQKSNCDKVSIGQKPLDPPALYEDAGEGYNSDYTYSQQ